MPEEYDNQDVRELSFDEFEELIRSCEEQEIPLDEFDKWMEELRSKAEAPKNRWTLLTDSFERLKELSEQKCMKAYRYLADCYYFGLGCERSNEDAAKYYALSMLTLKNSSSGKKLVHMEESGQISDPDIRRIIQAFRECDGDVERAIAVAAIMVMRGEVHLVAPEMAYCLLKRFYTNCFCRGLPEGICDGAPAYYLGVCVQDGIGTEKNPFTAQFLLEDAEAEYECICAQSYSVFGDPNPDEEILDDIYDRLDLADEQKEDLYRKNPEYEMVMEDYHYQEWYKEEVLIDDLQLPHDLRI